MELSNQLPRSHPLTAPVHPPERIQDRLSYTTQRGATQSGSKRLVMTPGKTLEVPGAAAAAEDPQDRDQQQQPLGVAHPSTFTAFRQGLQEGDQVNTGKRLG